MVVADPVWLPSALAIAAAFGTAAVAVWQGRKERNQPSGNTVEIAAGGLFASQPIIDLRVALSNHESVVRKNTDALCDLARQLERQARDEERDDLAQLRAEITMLRDRERQEDQLRRGQTP